MPAGAEDDPPGGPQGLPTFCRPPTVVQGEGAVQAAQVLKPSLHGACPTAEGGHCLGFPVNARMFGQPPVLDPAVERFAAQPSMHGSKRTPNHTGATAEPAVVSNSAAGSTASLGWPGARKEKLWLEGVGTLTEKVPHLSPPNPGGFVLLFVILIHLYVYNC